jgi:hypothetical protein
MSARDLITSIEQFEASCATNSYQLGMCLRELAKPERYRDEMGCETFEELLERRELPGRFQAFKLVSVVSTFSEAEVTQVGGMEKGYALIRYAKRQGIADARRFASPTARLLGSTVGKLSVRDINGALRTIGADENAALAMSVATKKAAKKASSRLGRALKRAGLKHRMRIHAHGDTCVSVHFDAPNATALADLLTKLKKLEKEMQNHV